MRILGQKSAAKRLAKRSLREENLETAPVEPNDQQTSNSNFLWNIKAQESSQKYSRSMFGYSDRHIRRLKQKNREAAKGSFKIDSMFQPIPSSTVNATLSEQTVEKDNLSPKDELKKKDEKATQSLSQFVEAVLCKN